MNKLAQLRAHAGSYTIGVDEVGFGAYAGPLVLAGVVSDRAWVHPLARDSKRFKEVKLKQGYAEFLRTPFVHAVVVGSLEACHVDAVGLGNAHAIILRTICEELYHRYPSPIVVDGERKPLLHRVPEHDVYVLPHAEDAVSAVGAASVIAKVHRDMDMVVYDQVYPGYGFAQHKGYHSDAHVQALGRLGACPIHRVSYNRVSDYVVHSEAWVPPRETVENNVWMRWLKQ